MPRYHTLGDIPKKRHTVFKNKNGGFYYEELFGTIGFDGMSSLMYHTQRPTQVKEILKTYSVSPKAAIENNMRSMMLMGFNIENESDYLKSGKTILNVNVNRNCGCIFVIKIRFIKSVFFNLKVGFNRSK